MIDRWMQIGNRKLAEAFYCFFSLFSAFVMQITSHHTQCPHVHCTHENACVVYPTRLYVWYTLQDLYLWYILSGVSSQTVCIVYVIRLHL
jgi:hypothetical protein